MLPTFELAGVTAGATICHDHYLGLLPRFLAGRGARLWVNPSYENVTDIKWSSMLRLRAVENRFFALCTLHCDVRGRETHPFGFAPDGSELFARPAGTDFSMPLSECRESGTIYIIDLDMAAVGRPLDWSKLPMAGKPKSARNGHPRKPVHVALRGGSPPFSDSRAGTLFMPVRVLKPTTGRFTREWFRRSKFSMRPRAFECSTARRRWGVPRSSGTIGSGFRPTRGVWRH